MKKLAILVLMAIMIFGMVTISNATTMPFSYGGHNYIVYYDTSTALTWGAAQTLARSFGSGYDLATITSAGEQSAVSSNLVTGVSTHFWIGGFQSSTASEPAGNWAWVTGEPFSYTAWNPGQPNNYSGDPLGTQDYLAMDTRVSGYLWDDVGGYPIYGFVAEKHTPVPEPATLLLLGSGLAGLGIFSRRRKKLHN